MLLEQDSPEQASEPASKLFSITQYNKGIERLLKKHVPRVWVQGVITQLNVRGRIAYLTLGEFPENDTSPKAVLQVCLWTNELEAYNEKFSTLATPFKLRVELKVAVLLEVSFYVPMGKFQPRICGIDENFTLGELYQTRQKILEALMREGLIQKNKSLFLSPVPLRVGLITAPGSAAYQDFTTVLLESGFSFRIYLAPARMQGDDTERTVLRAFELLKRKNLDVVCLVRGGGAKTDLVYFDSEKICRAIANHPVPVLTGIGHEIDNSLADRVAHADKITPTDCAKFLEGRLLQSYARIVEGARELSEAWESGVEDAGDELTQAADSLKHNWELRVAGERSRWTEYLHGLQGNIRHLFAFQRNRLRLNLLGIMRGPLKIVAMHKLRYANIHQKMRFVWKEWHSRRMARLFEAARLLRRLATEKTAGAGDGLVFKEKLIRAADPANLVKLGYAILKDSQDRIVSSIVGLQPGDEIRTRLKDGVVRSKVIDKEKEKHA